MAEAQLRDARRHVTLPPEGLPTGQCHALVVGIDHYADEHLDSLRHAVNDAEAVADKLEHDFGFRVTRKIDGEATARSVRAVLQSWQAGTNPGDSVVFFFAGHGDNDASNPEHTGGYLIPVDATEDVGTWLSETEIVRLAQQIRARRVFLVFDACYAGSVFQVRQEGEPDDQVLLGLMAGTSEEPVLDGGAGEHSIFTRSLLQGLDGFADTGQRPDDVISGHELITWVISDVPWRAEAVSGGRPGAGQTPVGGRFREAGTGAEFWFRPAVPRLPSPLLRNADSRKFEDRIAAAQQLGTRAELDSPAVLELKLQRLEQLLHAEDTTLADPEHLVDVRVAAVKGLGCLGLPGGAEDLCAFVESDGALDSIRAAAAEALGSLVQTVSNDSPEAAEACEQRAVGALVQALAAKASDLVEAAKLSLAKMPQQEERIVSETRQARGRKRRNLVDALACLTLHSPDCWPDLQAPADRLRRRIYLAHRRLNPQWRSLRRKALWMAVAGAAGLDLAYLALILGLFPANPYIAAMLTYSLLPGIVAGVSLAYIPALVAAVARKPQRSVWAAGGAAAGLLLGLGLALPSWFLHLGNNAAAWIVPNVIAGALLGFTLFEIPAAIRQAAGGSRRVWEPFAAGAAVAAVMALSFTLLRLPPFLAWDDVDPLWAGLARLALAGALFGAVVAAGFMLAGVWQAGPQAEATGTATGAAEPDVAAEGVTK